jgi:hypothetical protein
MSSGAFRLLITGSRDWTHYDAIAGVISAYRAEHENLIVVIGDAQGADALALAAAASLGVEYEQWEAKWRECDENCWHKTGSWCPLAGHRRNQQMVEAGADACEVFARDCAKPSCKRRRAHPSHGTADCAGRAAKARILVNWNTEKQ